MYTLNINTNEEELNKVLRFLQESKIEYSLRPEIDENLKQELEKRLAYSLAHPEEDLTWEEMEKYWKNEGI